MVNKIVTLLKILFMLRILSKIIFFLNGWKVSDQFKYPKKCIIIAAPHTSNWDFLIGRCYAYIVGISPYYLIKSSFFIPILGFLFKINGGIPVYRNSKNNLVNDIVNKFNNSNNFILAISPEGTRSRVETWKTGFYHIAIKSKVSIVLVAMDYKIKNVGVVDVIIPSGNIDSDLSVIENHFKNLTGKVPANYNPKIK